MPPELPPAPAPDVKMKWSTAGNPTEVFFTLRDPADWGVKFYLKLGSIETYQEPYCQVDYGMNKDLTFSVVTYCEGDIDKVHCATRADLNRELASIKEFYDKRKK